MELVASLPIDNLVAADPLARGPAPLLRPLEDQGTANPPVVPFELFLQLLNSPLPGGEPLPVDGNALPASQAALPLPVGAAEPPATAAAARAAPPTETLDDAAFERFGLTAALRAVLPPPLQAQQGVPSEPVATPAGPPAAGATAGNPAPPALDLAAGLDAAKLPLVEAAPLRGAPGAPGAETQTLAQQSASAGMVAEVESAAADEARSRARPVAMTSLPSADLVAAAGQSPAPVATAIAAAPLAATPADATRTGQRETAAPTPLLPASAVDAAGMPAADTSAAWQLPAASSTTTAPGAAPTAAPAAHGAAVDTRSPNWHDAFAGRVQWLVDHHVGEARIKLNPPELGAVDVKISLVDDKTFVQLTAGTAATRDELTQSLPRLRELLTASGLELGGATVQGGSDGRGGYQDRDARSVAPLERLAALGEDAQLPHRPQRAAGRIDTFA